jgi:hypothetical protein
LYNRKILKISNLVMRKSILIWVLAVFIVMAYSCGYSSVKSTANNYRKEKVIRQKEDGSLSLSLDKADFYSDVVDRNCNTAEWSVVLSKSGRYDVWLSSATKDTNDLKYKNPVLISLQDQALWIERRPSCDKIIHNSGDVSFPYFRADSFLGTLYIQDTGKFNIQIISEQILPKDYKSDKKSGADLAKLLSLSFKPSKR